MEKSYVYRSVEGLKVALIVLLALDMVLNVLSAGSSWMTIELLRRDFTVEEGDMNDLREGAIGLAQLSVFMVTVIVFGCGSSDLTRTCGPSATTRISPPAGP
jgi:hypothetical protein